VQNAAGGIAAFEGFDYGIMTEREQGMPWTTRSAAVLNRLIVDEHRVFRLVETFQLPNGDAARLYYLDRRAAAGP
jgi:hypothetical protein